MQKKDFIKKEALAQVFSCEFWEIFKNTFFTEHVWATAFEDAISAGPEISLRLLRTEKQISIPF